MLLLLVSPKYPAKRAREGEGKTSCGKQIRTGAESREGRRAARHASRLARCPPRLWLAPHFPWLPPTFLQGNSWPGLQTAGGGWHGSRRPLRVSEPGGQHADVASGERDRLGYVFTSCFLKAGQPSHLTLCFLPSICLHSRNLSFSFLPPPPREMLASREKGGGKKNPNPKPNNPMNKQTNLQPQVRLSINLRELWSVSEGGELHQGVAWVLPATLLHWVGPAIVDHYVHTTITVSVCVRAVSPPQNNNN